MHNITALLRRGFIYNESILLFSLLIGYIYNAIEGLIVAWVGISALISN